ncbi:MAG: type II toxin-antitoxin system prevent-host-death family antitoxin [Chthoniobacterales bacterium]|nr:type II toxin-antitoxin system prevent-host-death family antitoxin [Chthoniobacterales bacterium]
MQVTIQEAKAKLSELIKAVENGGEVVIARRKQPVARLVATKHRKRNRIGALAGRPFQMGWGFDDSRAIKRLANAFGVPKQ